MWRESVTHGDLTVGDFLERRYGRDLRLAVAILIWIGTLSILAAQLLGMSTVFQVVAGASTFAGLPARRGRSSASTSSPAVSSAPPTSTSCSSRSSWSASRWWRRWRWRSPAAGTRSLPIRRGMDLFAGGSPQSGWRLLFFLGPAFVVSPGLIQKAYGARDERAVTTGIALNGVALLAFAALPTLIGMSAHALHPEINKDLAFATMASELTPAFGALALAAVFSAEASAADAVLFMLATSGSRDLYRRVAASRDRPRLAARGAVVGDCRRAPRASAWR